jgi:hypothetical protein
VFPFVTIRHNGRIRPLQSVGAFGIFAVPDAPGTAVTGSYQAIFRTTIPIIGAHMAVNGKSRPIRPACLRNLQPSPPTRPVVIYVRRRNRRAIAGERPATTAPSIRCGHQRWCRRVLPHRRLISSIFSDLPILVTPFLFRAADRGMLVVGDFLRVTTARQGINEKPANLATQQQAVAAITNLAGQSASVEVGASFINWVAWGCKIRMGLVIWFS